MIIVRQQPLGEQRHQCGKDKVKHMKPIRFLHFWKGRVPGTIVDTFPHQMAAILVQRRIAEWVEKVPAIKPGKRMKELA